MGRTLVEWLRRQSDTTQGLAVVGALGHSALIVAVLIALLT